MILHSNTEHDKIIEEEKELEEKKNVKIKIKRSYKIGSGVEKDDRKVGGDSNSELGNYFSLALVLVRTEGYYYPSKERVE